MPKSTAPAKTPTTGIGHRVMLLYEANMKEKLRQALSLRQKHRIVATNRVPAAVLLPIFDQGGQYYILIIISVKAYRRLIGWKH